MSIEFKLPSIGEGVETADIAELLVSEGDTVEEQQVIAELETEKAVVELPCPHAGRISKIHVSEGDTISVGDLFLTIEDGEASGESSSAHEEDAAEAESAEAREDAEKDEQRREPAEEAAESDSDDVETEEETAGEQPAQEQGDADRDDAEEPDAEEQPQTIEFKLPAIGEGVESADVAEVHVSPGDEIDAEAVVMELETEKAVVELPCPHAGRIEEVHVSAGETIEVGQLLLTIQTTGKGRAAGTSAEKKPQKAERTERPEPKEKEGKPKPTERAPERKPAEEEKRTVITDVTMRPDDDGDGHVPVPAAPSTRRLARQLGVNLRQVSGSGAGGRITRDDVKAFVKQRLEGRELPAARREEGGLIAGSLAPPPLPDFTKYGEVSREKLSKLGRTAAENLTVSWNVIPHVTQHDRADVTDLESARKRFTQGAGKDGPKVTMTAIAIKALATCLQMHPRFNSSLDPETQELVYKHYYHVGCAVDTEHGLVVPVIRDCDAKSIREIAGELAEMAQLARDRKLPLDAMQGATCTVTNLGGIGGTAFTPIVNYPEVCILGMARSQPELRLIDGELHERLMLPLALSYDHRVINGADAARFVARLCAMLADPFQMLSTI